MFYLTLIKLLIGISIFISISLIIMWGIMWGFHLKTNKDENVEYYGWGNFKKFKTEFYKHKGWYIVPILKYEIYSDDCNYDVAADTVKFDGKCMNLYPISYLRYRLFCKKEWDKKILSKKEVK